MLLFVVSLNNIIIQSFLINFEIKRLKLCKKKVLLSLKLNLHIMLRSAKIPYLTFTI